MTIKTICRGHHALRKARVSLPNQIYLITVCCKHREKIFLNFDASLTTASTSYQVLKNSSSEILAWVLMPDHMHLVLQLGEEETLSKTMNRINSCCAIAINKVLRGNSPVWQGAYHDHALRDQEQLDSAIRYVISNPIRAGLVEKLGDYPYWNINIAKPEEALLVPY
jgi:putative transposase